MSYVTSLSLLFLIKKLSSKKKFDNYFSVTKLSAAPSQKAEPWKELKTVLASSLTVWALALWNWSGSASSWQYLNIAGPINLLKKSFMTQINDYKKCQQCPCKRLILVYKFQALCHKKKKKPTHTRNNRANDAIGGETYPVWNATNRPLQNSVQRPADSCSFLQRLNLKGKENIHPLSLNTHVTLDVYTHLCFQFYHTIHTRPH